MKPVIIKDDKLGTLTINENSIFYGLFKTNFSRVAFDPCNKVKPSNKVDEVYTDTSGTYDDGADFITNTLNCISLTGINEQAGFDVVVNTTNFGNMTAISGGTRIRFKNFSIMPEHLDVSETIAEINTAFDTIQVAAITDPA